MTPLERAMVVFAEAKGYETEIFDKGHQEWVSKITTQFFNFHSCEYRIKNKEDYRKVYDELADFFRPLYHPEQIGE